MKFFGFESFLMVQILILVSLCLAINAGYQVGIGIYDITGPCVQLGFLGYGSLTQKGSGIHLRQHARAFVIKESSQHVAFVIIEATMVGHLLRKQVLMNLKKKLGSIYTDQNFVLSATHTHSAPGGYMGDLLYDISTLGFVQETFDAMRSGIVKAVINAHNSIQDAKIFLNSGTLANININRSPVSYLLNPKSERDEYPSDVDKEMIQLKFVSSSNNHLLGALQWYPIHPTSMNNTNTLISTDNVGYASILLEQHFNKDELIGKGPFVAAFAPSNIGDVSPNTKGPICINTGDACDAVTSTCNGSTSLCRAFGPGNNMFESTKIIAEKLYSKALELLESRDHKEVGGQLRFGHRYVNMPVQLVDFTHPNGTITKVRGCVSALGYGFAAGTTDGAGQFDFKQGSKTENPLWNIVRNFAAEPTADDIACHYPKPIFLAAGKIRSPYRWLPHTVSIQTILLGDVIVAPVPGEFTTMSGRRLKKAIASAVFAQSGSLPKTIIIGGLSNSYSSYIATPEEYELQRYEAASTLYGPHTLSIYLKVYGNLVRCILGGCPLDSDPEPENLSKNLISLAVPVFFDLPLFGYKFGDCIVQPPSTAARGSTVVATFVAGNPRNNLMHGETFLKIERYDQNEWVIVATDSNWETKFNWKSVSFLTGISKATIEWYVDKNTPPGVYRIRHFGYQKSIYGDIKPYQGRSKRINVV